MREIHYHGGDIVAAARRDERWRRKFAGHDVGGIGQGEAVAQ